MVDQDKRDRPKGYIDKALDILAGRNIAHDIDILEIGCMRSVLTHHPDILDYQCCNDGHSTFLFARTGLKVVSVDIDPDHVKSAMLSCEKFDNTNHLTMDAIDFARSFAASNPPQTIGLLFLDAWDLELPDSADKHLEFYNIVKNCLNDDCLILIDDTDLWYDQEDREYYPSDTPLTGKGRLLIPQMCRDGYEIVFHGRQTLLRK